MDRFDSFDDICSYVRSIREKDGEEYYNRSYTILPYNSLNHEMHEICYVTNNIERFHDVILEHTIHCHEEGNIDLLAILITDDFSDIHLSKHSCRYIGADTIDWKDKYCSVSVTNRNSEYFVKSEEDDDEVESFNCEYKIWRIANRMFNHRKHILRRGIVSGDQDLIELLECDKWKGNYSVIVDIDSKYNEITACDVQQEDIFFALLKQKVSFKIQNGIESLLNATRNLERYLNPTKEDITTARLKNLRITDLLFYEPLIMEKVTEDFDGFIVTKLLHKCNSFEERKQLIDAIIRSFEATKTDEWGYISDDENLKKKEHLQDVKVNVYCRYYEDDIKYDYEKLYFDCLKDIEERDATIKELESKLKPIEKTSSARLCVALCKEFKLNSKINTQDEINALLAIFTDKAPSSFHNYWSEKSDEMDEAEATAKKLRNSFLKKKK